MVKNNPKTLAIYSWKRQGLIGDYESIYQRYMNTTHCDRCNILLDKINFKCMDHCHSTGKFRNILCNSCNIMMFDVKIYKHNTSGYKNISWDNKNKNWKFEKYIKKVRYQKYNKNINLLHWYKFVFLITKTSHLL